MAALKFQGFATFRLIGTLVVITTLMCVTETESKSTLIGGYSKSCTCIIIIFKRLWVYPAMLDNDTYTIFYISINHPSFDQNFKSQPFKQARGQ